MAQFTTSAPFRWQSGKRKRKRRNNSRGNEKKWGKGEKEARWGRKGRGETGKRDRIGKLISVAGRKCLTKAISKRIDSPGGHFVLLIQKKKNLFRTIQMVIRRNKIYYFARFPLNADSVPRSRNFPANQIGGRLTWHPIVRFRKLGRRLRRRKHIVSWRED